MSCSLYLILHRLSQTTKDGRAISVFIEKQMIIAVKPKKYNRRPKKIRGTNVSIETQMVANGKPTEINEKAMENQHFL